MLIIVNGFRLNLWLVLALALLAVVVLWYRRRKTRLQREMGRSLKQMNHLLGSIHPDQERLP